jgi:hypothetical protein
MRFLFSVVPAVIALLLSIAGPVPVCGEEDFAHYVRTSEDFRRVDLSPAQRVSERWDRWVLMPWRYDWGREYDRPLALELKDAGFNGAMCDYGPKSAAIHEGAGLLWYLDHAAGKGDLHLRPQKATREALASPVRPVCLADSSVRARLFGRLSSSVDASREFSGRIAYALDDEVSWSCYTNPCRWDNDPRSLAQFHTWLLARYGARAAVLEGWGAGAERFWDRMATPDDFQELYGLPWPQWNLSAWADAISFMDSQLGNLIGELVERANSIDPETPCGLVGGQCPAPYGGYDYAKLMRKVQFLEVYDLGAAAELARSLNPGQAMPLVKTAFGPPLDPKNVWFYWHHLIHGDRGLIFWAESWFRPERVSAHEALGLGPVIRELSRVSRIFPGARWRHDGIAIYYSHPSIQASWFIDCQPHGRTWINRSGSMDARLSSSAGTLWAWTKLLEDAGLQYDFYSYADLLEQELDPREYRLLILPRALALSDQEAAAMVRYVEAGGHILADHGTGWFDQHLRGRQRPALDGLFGVDEHPPAGPGRLFGGRLLGEIDAERYGDKNFVEAAARMWDDCLRQNGYVVAERDLGCFQEKASGQGWAHLMNVSVIEYLFLRVYDPEEATVYRQPILNLLERAGVRPEVRLRVDGKPPLRTEMTRWQAGERTVLCVARNPLVFGEASEPWQETLVPGENVLLEIVLDRPVEEAVDERTGRSLGDGDHLEVLWTTNEAAIVSFGEEDAGGSDSDR